MTLILMDGCEAVNGKTAWGAVATPGRTASAANPVGAATGTPLLFPAADASTTIICGFAIKLGSTTSPAQLIRAFNSAGVTIGTLEFFAQPDSASRGLRWVRGRDGVVLASTPEAVLTNGIWYYIEIKLVVAVAGSIEIRTNEVSRVTANADTLPGSGTAAVTRLNVLGNGNNTVTAALYDDVHICNELGPTNNNFLGDVEVHRLLPTAPGDASQLVPSVAGGPNWDMVNDYSNTDFNESEVLGNRDLYHFADLPAGVAGRVVFGLHEWIKAQTTAVPRAAKMLTKLGAAEATATTPLTVTDTYYGHRQETRPGGGNWTTADVDAAQHGVEVA